MIYHLFFVIAAIFIGTIGIFVKFAQGDVNPFVLGFYRLLFAFLLLLLISPLLDKTTFKVTRTKIKNSMIVGLLLAFNLSATNIAYMYAPIQNISLILALTPIFVLFFAYLILRESITRAKLITLAIALTGLVILNPLRAEGFIGNIIALIVVASGGLMFVLLRKINKNESIGTVMWFFLFATLFTLPFPFIFGFGNITLPIVSLGLISTGTAYLFYNLGYEKVDAEIGNLIANIITPLTAVILAFFIIGEKLIPRVILGGCLLIIAGVYLRTHLHASKTVRGT